MRTLLPDGWPRPRGYANGIEADGRLVFVAGQIGWTPEGVFEATTLAAQFAQSVYGEQTLGSGEGVWHHGLGMALILVGLKLDADCRLAALLFAVPTYDEQGLAQIESRFGAACASATPPK